MLFPIFFNVHLCCPGDPTIILDAIHDLPQLEMKPDNSAVRLKDGPVAPNKQNEIFDRGVRIIWSEVPTCFNSPILFIKADRVSCIIDVTKILSEMVGQPSRWSTLDDINDIMDIVASQMVAWPK